MGFDYKTQTTEIKFEQHGVNSLNGVPFGPGNLKNSITCRYTPELTKDLKEVWGIDFNEVATKVIQNKAKEIENQIGIHLEMKAEFKRSNDLTGPNFTISFIFEEAI